MRLEKCFFRFIALTVFVLILHTIFLMHMFPSNRATLVTTLANLLQSIIVSTYADYAYIHRPRDDFCVRDTVSRDLLFVALVPVSPKKIEHRAIIRSTWAQKQATFNFKVVFIMGHDDTNKSGYSISINEMIKQESEIYGDIVQINFSDTYYNLTTKTMMGFRWVSTYCGNAKYTLKVDDDMIVSVTHLTDYLNGLIKSTTHQTNSLLCMYHKRSFVFRDKSSKFYLSKEEYSQDNYDPYCDGQAYMLTTDLVVKMYNASLYVAQIKFEDVYVGVS